MVNVTNSTISGNATLLRTLSPANATAIVRGADGTSDIAVVEVYALN
jgi:hypothetical protein